MYIACVYVGISVYTVCMCVWRVMYCVGVCVRVNCVYVRDSLYTACGCSVYGHVHCVWLCVCGFAYDVCVGGVACIVCVRGKRRVNLCVCVSVERGV